MWIEDTWDVYESRIPVYFPVGYLLPRVCSHCGAGHPEDLLVLAAAGWELEDNRRLQPPGHARYMAHVAYGLVGHLGPFVRSPVPPVKAYAAHFTTEQLRQLNAHLDSRSTWPMSRSPKDLTNAQSELK